MPVPIVVAAVAVVDCLKPVTLKVIVRAMIGASVWRVHLAEIDVQVGAAVEPRGDVAVGFSWRAIFALILPMRRAR